MDFGSVFDSIYGGAGDVASWLGNTVKQQPLEALALGMGAAGTGLGIYDRLRANEEMQRRNKAFEGYAQQGPQFKPPDLSYEQVQAYMRPWMADEQTRGVLNGGAWRAAAAEAADKLKLQTWQMGQNQGLQDYYARLGAYGQTQPVPANGSVGGFGQALQNLMLMRALSRGGQYPGQQQPSTTYQPIQYSGTPQYGQQGPQTPNNFYPQSAMGGSFPNSMPSIDWSQDPLGWAGAGQ